MEKVKKILQKFIINIDKHASKFLVVPFFAVVVLVAMILANMVGNSYAALLPVESLPNHLTSRIESVGGSLIPARSNYIPGVLAPSGLVKRFYSVDDEGNEFDIYCLDRWLAQNRDVSYTKAQSALEDKGMAYLLSQIYPNNDKFLSGKNEDVKRYISQLTIWYYQDRKAGFQDTVDSCDTSQAGVDPVTCKKSGEDAESDTTYYWKNSLLVQEKNLIKASEYWSAMESVITEALAYKENTDYGISINREEIQFELTKDEKYMESNLITVTTKGSNFLGYTLTTNDDQVKFYNEDNTEIQKGTSVDVSTKFKIRVPIEAVRNKGALSINVDISGSFSSKDAYMYFPGDNAFQRALVGVMQLTPINTGASLIIEDPMGSAKIIKKDKTTGQALEGATLVLSTQEGTEVARWTSKKEPHVIDPIKEGTYILKEESAPDGYVLNSESITVTIKKGEQTTVEMENIERGRGEFRKTDAVTSEEVAGATLIITNDKGQEVTRWVSTTTPHVVPLDDGTYTLTEEIAPNGYVKNTQSVTFTITAGKTTPVEMKNEPYGKASILKIDAETKKPLEGATLVLYDQMGSEVDRFVSTTKAHEISLPSGTYRLKEEKVPIGYVLKQVEQSVIITAGQTTTVTMENISQGKAKIIKIDSVTKEPLEGATLVIRNAANEIVKRFVTTKEPYVLENLEDGLYTLTEEKAPKGYVKNEEVQNITITQGQTTTVTMENEPYGIIEVQKISAETKEPLAGATIIISDLKGAEMVRFVTTEEPYQVALPQGVYELTELYAPEGYVRSKESMTFTLKAGEIFKIEVSNVKEIHPPDTGKKRSNWLYVLGTVLLVFSIGLIRYATLQKKKKQA